MNDRGYLCILEFVCWVGYIKDQVDILVMDMWL